MQNENREIKLPSELETHFGRKYMIKKIGAAITLTSVNLLEVFIGKVSFRKMKKSMR